MKKKKYSDMNKAELLQEVVEKDAKLKFIIQELESTTKDMREKYPNIDEWKTAP